MTPLLRLTTGVRRMASLVADPRLADATEIASAGLRAAALTKQLHASSLEERLVITSERDAAGAVVPAPIGAVGRSRKSSWDAGLEVG